MTGEPETGGPAQWDIPARLERLPWTGFHTRLVAALGVTWVLDGLEVTIVGALGPALQSRAALGLTATQLGETASIYLVGAILGALAFGWWADRSGRRRIVFVTLSVYLAGVFASALSPNLPVFALSRLITGLGIGGEYAAINSAIDEMAPARVRGRVALAVNGAFWLGAAAGAAASPLLLDARLFPPGLGWRLGFAIGGVLGLGVLLLRRNVPESPRWLALHGRLSEAQAAMSRIEAEAGLAPELTAVAAQPEPAASSPFVGAGFRGALRALTGRWRGRALLVLGLMGAQAFLYNALFFTYAVVLTTFEHVAPARAGLYLLPLAAGNFPGPVLLGPLFDSLGRRVMIALCYGLSGALMVAAAGVFAVGGFTATTQTLAWMAIFAFASAAASAAYLSASELFPLEVRALAISIFYAAGTLIGGVAGPVVYGALIETGQRSDLAWGYGGAAVLMLAAAIAQARFGVAAERKPLEAVAPSDPAAMERR